MKKLFLSAVVFLSATLSAQEINSKAVYEMKMAGLGDEVIINAITNAKTADFDLSPSTLIQFKKIGLSDEIISLMQNKQEIATIKAENDEIPSRYKSATTMQNMREENGVLKFGENGQLQKGDIIQVYIPAHGEDFMFVNESQSGLSKKLVKGLSGVVSSGAMAVGGATGNIRILEGAYKTARTAENVRRATEVLEQVDSLPISKKAKSIAGKELTITGWKKDKNTNDYIVNASLGKKKYEINFREAITTGEIVLE